MMRFSKRIRSRQPDFTAFILLGLRKCVCDGTTVFKETKEPHVPFFNSPVIYSDVPHAQKIK